MVHQTRVRNAPHLLPRIEGLEPRLLLSADLFGSYFEARFEERCDGDGEPLGGGTLSVHYIISNGGDEAARRVKVSFYASTDEFIDPAEDELIKTVTVSVGPGQSEDGGWSMSVSDESLIYCDATCIGMVIDPDGDLAETDKDNNANLGEQVDLDEMSEEWDVLASPRAVLTSKHLKAGQTVSGAIDGSRSVDVFRFTADSDGLIGLDIDCRGSLDSFITVYDANWDVIAIGDDEVGPGDEISELESYLELDVLAGKTYVIVVSNCEIGDAGLDTDLEDCENLTGSYTLEVEALPLPDDWQRPGDEDEEDEQDAGPTTGDPGQGGDPITIDTDDGPWIITDPATGAPHPLRSPDGSGRYPGGSSVGNGGFSDPIYCVSSTSDESAIPHTDSLSTAVVLQAAAQTGPALSAMDLDATWDQAELCAVQVIAQLDMSVAPALVVAATDDVLQVAMQDDPAARAMTSAAALNRGAPMRPAPGGLLAGDALDVLDLLDLSTAIQSAV